MAIVINGSGTVTGISVGGLPDNIVDAGTLADDAVGLAQMAAGTDGNIITYDTSGNPAAVATGSSGQVLTSAGAGAAPTMAAAAAGGKILQVLQVEDGTLANTTSSTYQDSSIAVTITPSATTSKILVFATVNSGVSRNDTQKYGPTIRLYETVTTNVFPTGTDGNFGNLLSTYPSGFLGYMGGVISGNWLHSPSSTSALTYKVQFKSWSGTNTVYINTPDGTSNWGATKSTITVMEIGA